MDERVVKVGERYGHLEVIKLNNKHPRGNSWLCRCDCGKEIILGTVHLLGSKTRRPNRSCGCAKDTYNGQTLKYKKLYKTWHNLINRCYNPNADYYEYYGGKGIGVEEEWRNSFENFLQWSLENGYKEHLTIDRIDPNKDYGPSNCRWSDNFVQAQNRSVLRNNKTGVTGVCYDEKQGFYRAYISRKKVRKFLGCFKTLEEAVEARMKAEEHYKKYGTIEDL
jgi:hypothetical protein